MLILVVDDVATTAGSLRASLQGHTVEHRRTADGLSVADQERADLLLIDYHLAESDVSFPWLQSLPKDKTLLMSADSKAGKVAQAAGLEFREKDNRMQSIVEWVEGKSSP